MALNPGKDGEAAMSEFRSRLVDFILMKFGMIIEPDSLQAQNQDLDVGTFLEFDSSNNRKFSRHVIVCLPNNNILANQFQVYELKTIVTKNIDQKYRIK